eukprot:jgi/Bigna1/71549/fgenesh1_pg.16_\
MQWDFTHFRDKSVSQTSNYVPTTAPRRILAHQHPLCCRGAGSNNLMLETSKKLSKSNPSSLQALPFLSQLATECFYRRAPQCQEHQGNKQCRAKRPRSLLPLGKGRDKDIAKWRTTERARAFLSQLIAVQPIPPLSSTAENRWTFSKTERIRSFTWGSTYLDGRIRGNEPPRTSTTHGKDKAVLRGHVPGTASCYNEGIQTVLR